MIQCGPYFSCCVLCFWIPVPTLFLLPLLIGETLPRRLSEHVLQPGRNHLQLVRVRRLVNDQSALPQPHLRAQIIFASLLPAVLVVSRATPQPLLFRLRPFWLLVLSVAQ